MGLSVGLIIYMLLRRKGVSDVIAAIAIAPQLLDASFLRLEHAILSDALFILLVVAGVVALLWPMHLTVRHVLLAGLLLGSASVVRTIALPLICLIILCLALGRSVGWRRLGIFAAAAMLPIAGHGVWFLQAHGSFSLTGGNTGALLWARVMTFADCSIINPPADEAAFCPNGIVKDAASEYVWDPGSALNRYAGDTEMRDRLAARFALRAILAQPLDYLWNVTQDTSIAFALTPIAHPKRTTPAYGFGLGSWVTPDNPLLDSVRERYDPAIGTLRSVDPYASILVRYQYVGYLHGPLKLLIVLVGTAGLVCRPRRALVPWAAGMFLLVGPVMVLDFDHRYVLPAIPLLSLAAALAVHDLLGLWRKKSS
ncbi:hypothetical protein DP939_22935 [Spongiactinospora rosea]|uniref:Glycosyltransferase RgtA/B/C/D-like domain-containing protein n=2 Tax=Spongiactinospora rosea TaxID=2248750 RepID=A0A366LVW3_9ACTN|nr:hypothetical protein DP939_22935 [Spongiactinospora rosea]